MTNEGDEARALAFGRRLTAARERAGLSVRKLARQSSVAQRRIADFERGAQLPDDRELGLLAQGCNVSVFDLLPPGFSLEVLVPDGTGVRADSGDRALDALLREYLRMVLELRSGNAVTAASLRHEDLVELAGALGDSREAIESRLVALLDADVRDVSAIRSMILPSTASA